MKIDLQIKMLRQKMFLKIDFCMEKLLAKEVTIFPEIIKSLNSLSTMHKTNTK